MFRSTPQHLASNRLAGPRLSITEVANYSIVRAIEAAREGHWRGAPFERDVTLDALERQGDPDTGPHRLIVPGAVLTRDLNASTTTAGGYLADAVVQGVVDALRPVSVVLRAGAQTLTGLRGNQTYARQGGIATITWMPTETTQATETATLNFGQLAISPKTVSAFIEESRTLKLMAPDLAEAVARDTLRKSLATALDLAAISGSGASGQPTGITNTAGIGAFAGASLAYAGLLEAQTDVLTNNALGGGEVTFVCRPTIASLLAARQGFGTTAPMWIGPLAAGQLVHCPAFSSMNVPADTLIGGDFAQLLIAEWGVGIEVKANPYANFQAGIEGYAAFLTCDVALLVRESFTVATSIT